MLATDYFKNENKQSTKITEFGLCDDNDKKPAYINADNKGKWIGIIENNQGLEIAFYPVDNCIVVKRKDDSNARRCEGILSYDNIRNIIFVELKDRKLVPSEWIKDADEQIKETMLFFFENHSKNEFEKVRAWICNKQLTNQNYWQQIKQFKKDTNGMVLYIQRRLSLPI